MYILRIEHPVPSYEAWKEALMVAPIDGAKRDMLDIVPPVRLGPTVPVFEVSVHHCGEPSGSPQAL